jgi:Cation transport ATPase
LQRQIDFVVRLVMLLVALMSATILLQAALEGFSLVRVVQTTAVLSGLVPYGLFFLVALAYTVGAARSAGNGALVQQVNAVESMSNVDVVCTDKTGTLTTGRLALAEVVPVGPVPAGEVDRLVGSMARSAATGNLTTAALAAALPGEAWAVRDEVPFSSSLRWSALRTDDGVHVLGAPDRLAPQLAGEPLTDAVTERTAQGLRVLVVARAADPSHPNARHLRPAAAARPRTPWPWWSSPTSCGPGSPRRSRGSPPTAPTSRWSPATTPAPWRRWPGRPDWTAASR